MLSSGNHIDWIKKRLPTDTKGPIKELVRSIRLIGADNRLLPDFIIGGTRKGGTTSLYNYLVKHPQIMRAFEKEIEYFDSNPNKSLTWYKSHFPFKIQSQLNKLFLNKQIICGEATPNYIYSTNAIEKLFFLNPKLKLIFLLREPVERAVSDYKYAVRRGAKDLKHDNFQELINEELDNIRNEDFNKIFDKEHSFDFVNDNYKYIGTGLYYYQLKEWLKVFPENQILILDSSDFFSNTKELLEQVQRFLNIEIQEIREYKNYLPGNNVVSVPKEILTSLVSFYEPHNEKLFNLIGKKIWKKNE